MKPEGSRQKAAGSRRFVANVLPGAEEALRDGGMQYEVWSPYDAPGAAHALLAMLDADESPGDASQPASSGAG